MKKKEYIIKLTQKEAERLRSILFEWEVDNWRDDRKPRGLWKKLKILPYD